MKLNTLLAQTDAVLRAPRTLNLAALEIGALVSDVRAVGPATLFAALDGPSGNGRAQIPTAIQRGCVAVLTDRPDPTVDVPQILTREPRRLFGQLCGRFHGEPQRNLRVIGVTGRAGKTSVGTILEQTLALAGLATGRAAHQAAEPLEAAFAQLAQQRELGRTHVALEVAPHALSHGPLCGIELCAAVFSTLSNDSLDAPTTADTLADHVNRTARLFGQVGLSGFAAVNGDDPASSFMIGASWCAVKTYGTGRHNAYRATAIRLTPAGSRFAVLFPGGRVEITSKLAGEHHVRNLLAAFTVAHGLGIPAIDAARFLTMVAPVSKRFEAIMVPGTPGAPAPLVVQDAARSAVDVQSAVRQMATLAPRGAISVVADLAEPWAATLLDATDGVETLVDASTGRAAAIERAVLSSGPDDAVLVLTHDTAEESAGGLRIGDDREWALRSLRRWHKANGGAGSNSASQRRVG